VTFANPLPWWALVVVLAGVVLLGHLAYSRAAVGRPRRLVLGGLRAVTLFTLVVILMRPVRMAEGAGGRAVVPILVDSSRSMGIVDAAGMPRIGRAREFVTRELVPRLAQEFDVEVLAIGESVRAATPSALAAADRRSEVAGGLRTAAERYRGRPVPGMILLSDGGDTEPLPSSEDAGTTPPVFAFGFGSVTVANDREILSETVADPILDDSRVDIDVTAVSHGQGTEPLALGLLENGRPIEVRRVVPAGDGIPVHQRFHVTPAHGVATIYTVEVPVAGGELVPENNSRSVLVPPAARLRRVLFAEGAPGFEHSFLKRAWSADAGLEVDSIVRKGKNDQGKDTFYIQAPGARSAALVSGFPQRMEDLCAYDALVLANVESSQLTQSALQATRAFVARRGGGLLVLGTRSFGRPGLAGTPLEDVLPLHLSDRGDAAAMGGSSRGVNLVSLTAAGESHPVMQLGESGADTRRKWDSAPALAFVAPLGGPRPGASVLAVAGGPGGTSQPLVAVQRYGEGRAMVFTGEAAWRWRMLLPSSDRSYETFWRQALRWLALPAPSPVALVLPAAASPGESLTVRVRVRTPVFEPAGDAAVDVFVTFPGGRVDRLHASNTDGSGDYAVGFTPAQAGMYRIAAEARRGSTLSGSATTSLLVGGADSEMSDPRLNTHALARLVRLSGGRVIEPSEGGTGDLLLALRGGVAAARLSNMQDVWNTGPAFGLIVLLLATEWVLRRRWGLR
jgi:uncharacterized membrane protein